MASAPSIKIVIIGSGNLAWHLATFFKSKKLKPEVYNHRPSAELTQFKQKLGLKTVSGLNNIRQDADYYFICVSDRHIAKVSKKIKTAKEEALVLHCSGSMPLKELSKTHQHKAVLYPLQSFSKNTAVNWKDIPLFLQASETAANKKLTQLLKLFPGKKVLCEDESRLRIHLAAVLVNNFTNALYAEAQELMGSNYSQDLFQLMLPFIKNGLGKLDTMSPLEAQTGPAKRKDKVVMKKHLQVLKKNKDLSKLYRLMSAIIAKQQNKIYA
jgi:predicted short-subunit dehydrogenase-like oxidoreductase (DUF2520 family)